jgi:hypothetical protein
VSENKFLFPPIDLPMVRGRPTGDVLVEDVIFLDDIVDDLLARFVEHEYLPLL